MKLSIGLITARQMPCVDWLIDSLRRQLKDGDEIQVIVVWEGKPKDDYFNKTNYIITDVKQLIEVIFTEPKPCVWQGAQKVTKETWWAKCNQANTFLCMAKHDFIAILDDRCVLQDGWLDAIKKAEQGKYIVAGAYEKRHNMVVKNGLISDWGELQAKDPREGQVKTFGPIDTVGGWLFGCNLAMPLEWALRVNGYPELLCDSLSFEDVCFGVILQNNHYPMKFDKSMKIVEDRTPGSIGCTILRTDKGVSPNDKSHAALAKAQTMKKSENPFGDIRELREKVLRGEPIPFYGQPTHDWWDNAPVCDFK